MKRITLTAMLIAATPMLAVAGCGQRQPLRPAQGAGLPPKPATAAAQPTVDALLAPATTTRPARSDELLTKSQERREDRFDLPPPG